MYRIVVCIENNNPYRIFGDAKGGVCLNKQIYYANRCSNNKYYYISGEKPELDANTHTTDSYMGLYESIYFVTLAEWREKQIDDILND